MKDRFMFFYNFKQTADNLPDELRLKFYDALTAYAFVGEEPDEPIIRALVSAFKPSLDKEERRGGNHNPTGQNGQSEVKDGQNRSKLVKVGQSEKISAQSEVKDGQNGQTFLETETETENIPPLLPKGNIPPQGDATTGKKFVKPSVEEVSAYCRESGHSIDCGAFVDFYESKGWKVGNSPMKDWRAAVRNWERGDKAAGGRKALQSDEEFYRQLEAL